MDAVELVPSGAAKPFAVLRLTDLRIFRFEHKDEMHDAIRAMRERDAGFVPLLWDAWGETWKMPEIWQ
jgi:hypothetical protein